MVKPLIKSFALNIVFKVIKHQVNKLLFCAEVFDKRRQVLMVVVDSAVVVLVHKLRDLVRIEQFDHQLDGLDTGPRLLCDNGQALMNVVLNRISLLGSQQVKQVASRWLKQRL